MWRKKPKPIPNKERTTRMGANWDSKKDIVSALNRTYFGFFILNRRFNLFVVISS